MSLSVDAIISLIGVLIFGLLISLTTFRWRLKEGAIAVLSIYLGLSLAWSIGTAVQTLDIFQDPGPAPFFELLTDISRSAMPLVFGALTLAFLSKRQGLYWYCGFSGLILAILLALRLNSDVTMTILSALFQIADINILIRIVETSTWAVATLVAPWVIVTSLRRKRQAQFRNRLRYWVGGIIILSTANLILLLQQPGTLWLGSTLNIVGTSFITYIIARSHLPDLQVITNRLLVTIAVAMVLSVFLSAALYGGVYLANGQKLLPQNISVLLLAASVTLAIILPRFARWTEQFLTKLLLEAGFDISSTIRAYSQNVSDEHDLEKLGQRALNFIFQEMGIKRGALFVKEGDGSGHVSLKLVASVNIPQVNTGYFFAEDPWVKHMRQNQTAVTQYDLDVLPEYKTMDENSKDWLASLDMELFYPVILREREFIGVLALGQKPNNRPYLDQDLNRLHVLASQMAIDIDKTKMFNQLGAVNLKLGEMSKMFESFDKGKADFLSIASHELRTPLTHIHGYASMLMEATQEELHNPAYLQNVFNGIAKGSNRLKTVVDRMFDVSRAETGEMKPILDEINLAQIVNEAAESQKSAIQQRQHNLIISGLEQLPTIQADAKRLTQAVTELLNNAIKYTPDGGAITITGRMATENNKPHVELIITDNGIGINPEDQTRIFDKFYRVDNIENHSTSGVKFKGAGPGLGLPLAAGIARIHGGRVWAESPKYDEGTCPGSQFHLVLPVEPDNQAVEEAIAAISPSTAKTRHWRSDDIKAVKERAAQQPNK